MFKRQPQDEQAATPGRSIDTLIGRTARVQGDVEFSGGLHLDGQVTGNVRAARDSASSLSVSANGLIEGSVQVPRVTLNGSVKGDIFARERVVLGAQARVEGNVHYGVIEIASGAQITGRLIPNAGVAPAAAPEGFRP